MGRASIDEGPIAVGGGLAAALDSATVFSPQHGHHSPSGREIQANSARSDPAVTPSAPTVFAAAYTC